MESAVLDEAAADAFGKRFFAEPNRLRWTAIESGQLPPATLNRLKPWLDRLRRGRDPIILPFAAEDETVWYAATTTARAFRYTRAELAAFLGLTYSDFGGQPTILDPANQVEAALAATFGRNVLRIHVPRRYMETARSRLELFAKLLDEAPRRTEILPRPVGRILADFEEGLRLGDDSAVGECIEECERNGQLDAQNLLYLRIRRDEGRQDWQAILDAARRYHLISAARRPRRVSEAILRAVYATTLASYESTRDPAGAIKRFREDVYVDYAPLLATRKAYECSEADALFVMRAVSVAKNRQEALGALAAIDEEALHQGWLAALIEFLPEGLEGSDLGTGTSATPVQGVAPGRAPDVGTDSLSSAREAFFSGDLDRAWNLASTLGRSEGSAQLLIACACDIGTLSAAQEALDSLSGLSEPERQRLEERNSVASNLERLRQLLAPPVAVVAGRQPQIPQNWGEWFEALSANQDWKEAATVAESGSLEWDPREVEKEESATRIAKALSELRTSGYSRISESLPHILRGIARCSDLPRRFGEVLETLTLIHLCDEAPGRLFFGTLADLCTHTLGLGVTREAYTGLLAECIGAITRGAGPADFDGILDLLDVLMTYATPDPVQRGAVADTIAELFVRFRSKADTLQLAFLGCLLQDAGRQVPATLTPERDPERSRNPLASLAGRTIALYSLNEPALHRVAKLLEDTIDSASVTVFHDKAGGSSALRSAARNADIFVIATAAAKHAATEFIEEVRGSQAVTLKPRGQGSASMLLSLREYARSGSM
jgi:hypothetical protein